MTQFLRRLDVWVVVVSLAGACAVGLIAQERITLSAPETAPSNLTYRSEGVSWLENDPDTPVDESFLRIQLVGVERRVAVSCTYTANTTPTATFLIDALNKANLSSAYNNNATTGTLKQRIFHRLIVMGESTAVCGKTLTGSLTGTPQ